MGRACSNINAFERRLIEVLATGQPGSIGCKFFLLILVIGAIGAVWFWSDVLDAQNLSLPKDWQTKQTLLLCAILGSVSLPIAVFLAYVLKNAFATKVIVTRVNVILDEPASRAAIGRPILEDMTRYKRIHMKREGMVD